jgi:hypothetical protein
MPARPLDHLVLGTHELDQLAGEFESLGFRVGARNRHPWGTENRLIQLADDTFLELITVGEGAEVPPHQTGHFSFGAFVAEGIAREPGLSMMVLKSDDAKADARRFAHDGIGAFAPFEFGRKGQRADGSEVELAFTLAFARARELPECGFFVCQQHFPENFWSPALQQHANGASGIARVTLVAENPSDHHVFLSAFAGSRELRATSSGISVACGSTLVEIVMPETFRFHYGLEPSAGAPHFAGFGLHVSEPAAMAGQAARMGLGIVPAGDGFTLKPRAAFATAIRLEGQAG